MARCHPRSYLIESSVRWPRRFFENEEDSGGTKKKKKCVSKPDISYGGGGGGRMWLPTLVGYCTNRCDHSIKTFLYVSRGEGRLFSSLFHSYSFYFHFIFFSNGDGWKTFPGIPAAPKNRAANHLGSHGLPSHPLLSPSQQILFSLADGLRNLFFYQTGHYKINSSPSLQMRGKRRKKKDLIYGPCIVCIKYTHTHPV